MQKYKTPILKAAFLILFQQAGICQAAPIAINGFIFDLNGTAITTWDPADFHISFIEGTGTIYDGEVLFISIQDVEYLLYSIEIGSDAINDDQIIPDSPSLSQNYPNPFNPSTIIKARTPEPAKFEIFDIAGREIVSTQLEAAGEYSLCWAGLNAVNKPVSSGIYFY